MKAPGKYGVLFASTVIGFLIWGAWVQAAIMAVYTVACWSDE